MSQSNQHWCCGGGIYIILDRDWRSRIVWDSESIGRGHLARKGNYDVMIARP